MEILSVSKIKLNVVEQNYPVLFNTLTEKFSGLSTEDKEKIAGLVLDVILRSGGEISILDDEDETYFDDDEFN